MISAEEFTDPLQTDTYEETQDAVNETKKETGIKTTQEYAEGKINDVKKTISQ